MSTGSTWLKGLEVGGACLIGAAVSWLTASLLLLLVAGVPVALVLSVMRVGFGLPMPSTGDVFGVLHPLFWAALAPLHIGKAAGWIARKTSTARQERPLMRPASL